ncbi:hypothetical protein, partial [Escherichia coli]|uniref:hypothetical protein n=1 Tax=Escherichia coli TaxID=562 RepID=UPI00215A134F
GGVLPDECINQKVHGAQLSAFRAGGRKEVDEPAVAVPVVPAAPQIEPAIALTAAYIDHCRGSCLGCSDKIVGCCPEFGLGGRSNERIIRS